MGKIKIKVEDMGKKSGLLMHVDPKDLPPLPPPYDRPENIPPWKPLKDKAKETFESSLDDTIAVSIPKPQSKEEEDRLVALFLTGLEKLFTKENNWTFLQPLVLSMEHCAKCNTCSAACHIYEMSGNNELYRPTYRSDVLRRLYFKHLTPGGKLIAKWRHGDIDLNWTTIARLIELSYRCNLCRRCAQTCPIGVDNGLIGHELRKLFHQEMGIVAKELHDRGAMLQLKVGSSTGMNPEVVKDNIEFIDEDTSEKVGFEVKTPWDKKGADVLLIHNAGEIMAWPENHGAFAVIMQKAGINWTLSSESQEALGYDNINYGLWYDDFMLAKVAIKHALAAKKLGVKKLVIGECGHAHKALTVIADRVLTGDLNVRRESAMPLLRDIVFSGKLNLDPSRNNFPVTLHDPCNYVRLMGIVEPQREIVRKIAPLFREMEPHGVNNYCCGGGSGFAIMSGHNFMDWRMQVSGRKKLQQILEAFQPEIDPSINKYVCAPCSNCKGQIRDIINYWDVWNKTSITYGGLVELIVNCMTDCKPGYLEWGTH
jgi:Fe-S oxidoreductase